MVDAYGHEINKGDIFSKWDKDYSKMVLCIAIDSDRYSIGYSKLPRVVLGYNGPFIASHATSYLDRYTRVHARVKSSHHIVKLYPEHLSTILNLHITQGNKSESMKDIVKYVHKKIF